MTALVLYGAFIIGALALGFLFNRIERRHRPTVGNRRPDIWKE